MPTELDTDRIRELRKAKGLTMEVAAKAAKLGSRQRWSDIEAGGRVNVSIDVLSRIADALGCDACKLLKRPGKAKAGKP